MNAVGDGFHRPVGELNAWPDRTPHFAGHLPVEPAYSVDPGRCPQRQRRHIKERTVTAVITAEIEEMPAARLELSPPAGELVFDRMQRKDIMPGGHRRVSGEGGRLPYLVERRFESFAAFHQLAYPLQDNECGMTFVQVPDIRMEIERSQGAHPADAENDLLAEARLVV